MFGHTLALAAVFATTALSATASLEECPGYKVSNVRNNGHTLKADLQLAGKACNVYGEDIKQLKLRVEYQTRKAPHHLDYL